MAQIKKCVYENLIRFYSKQIIFTYINRKKAPLISSIINIQHKYYQSDINNISL